MSDLGSWLTEESVICWDDQDSCFDYVCESSRRENITEMTRSAVYLPRLFAKRGFEINMLKALNSALADENGTWLYLLLILINKLDPAVHVSEESPKVIYVGTATWRRNLRWNVLNKVQNKRGSRGVNQKGRYSGVRVYRRTDRGKGQGEVSERSGLLHWPAETPGRVSMERGWWVWVAIASLSKAP